jgi:hypothetical protein
MKNVLLKTIFLFSALFLYTSATAASSGVPEPFRGFDNDSTYDISYEDLTAVLRTVVVDVGRSTREVAAPSKAKTGTRMKASVKRSTVNEANRFYFETFKNNDEAKQLMMNIQQSLEDLPSEVSLEYFSRDEQLAYWLNLYNITLLNQVIEDYPIRSLKKVVKGKQSYFDKKLLNVAGVSLSLNDIQFNILKNNYDANPLIIYGLHQGYIGSPNIRRRAYTGSDVWRALENNAIEFINSNRGTYAKDEKTFRVSSFYNRSGAFFPNFNQDLKKHLMAFIKGPERSELQLASNLKADINDFTVVDLGGTHRDPSAAFADNNAALLDSIKSSVSADGGGVIGAAVGAGSASMASKGKPMQRIDPELLGKLQEINTKREQRNIQNATVTVEELGTVEPDQDPDDKDDSQ